MVTHKNDVVRFKPPIEIDGRTEYYVASERFPDYVGHLRGAVKISTLTPLVTRKGKRSRLREPDCVASVSFPSLGSSPS